MTALCTSKDEILEQFQTHQKESDKNGNALAEKKVNNAAPEQPSRLAVESSLDVLKNAILYSKTGDKIQSFLLKLES